MPTPTRQIVVEELDIASLPIEAQDEIIGTVGQNILLHVLLRTVEKLPHEAQEAFRALSEEGRGAEAEDLARRHIPEYDAFVAEESGKALNEFKRIRDALART